MRNHIPIVGILLALLFAWLVFSQPTPDSINAGGATQVQDESPAQLAPEVLPGELTSAETGDAEAIPGTEDPELRREAVSDIPEGMAEIGVMVVQAESSQALMFIEVRA